MKYLKTFEKIQKLLEAELAQEEPKVEQKPVDGESPKVSRDDIKMVRDLLDADYDSFIKALTF
jgi:NACalpha-BTF3-like transcription factor